MIAEFKLNQEDMEIMRIVMNENYATRLRFSGGVELPWSQCAFR